MEQNEHGAVLAGAGIGWDTGAALALGMALEIAASVIAELLLEIATVMVRKLNEQMASGYRSRIKP